MRVLRATCRQLTTELAGSPTRGESHDNLSILKRAVKYGAKSASSTGTMPMGQATLRRHAIKDR
jgi:hypothetical protein